MTDPRHSQSEPNRTRWSEDRMLEAAQVLLSNAVALDPTTGDWETARRQWIDAYGDTDRMGCGAEQPPTWDAYMAAVRAIERHKQTVRDALHLIRDLTDRDPCWLDHHGGCQAHGYLSLEPGEKCPHQEAKELLAAEGVQE